MDCCCLGWGSYHAPLNGARSTGPGRRGPARLVHSGRRRTPPSRPVPSRPASSQTACTLHTQDYPGKIATCHSVPAEQCHLLSGMKILSVGLGWYMFRVEELARSRSPAHLYARVAPTHAPVTLETISSFSSFFSLRGEICLPRKILGGDERDVQAFHSLPSTEEPRATACRR